MLRISLAVAGGVEVRAWLRRIRAREVPRSRRGLVRRVSRGALQSAVRLNPVDTGRARAAWVQSLEELGGTAPAGWEGPHPESAAVTEGRELGSAQEYHQTDATEVRATSRVDYINYLEFGTRKMSPFQMVWRSLQMMRATIPHQPFFAAPPEN